MLGHTCVYLQVRDGVIPAPVHFDPDDKDIFTQLEAAAATTLAQGHSVKALLITHPNNPLGTCYSNDELYQMLKWCLHRRVHCVRYACVKATATTCFFDAAAVFTKGCVGQTTT